MTIYIEPEYVTRLEDENEQLKQQLKEQREKKKEVYKWAYSLEKENALLKEENDKLKQELFNLYLKHYN